MVKIIDWDTHKVGGSFLSERVEQLGKPHTAFYVVVDNDTKLFNEVKNVLLSAGVKYQGVHGWPSGVRCKYIKVYLSGDAPTACVGHYSDNIHTGKPLYSADNFIVPKSTEEKADDVSCTSGLVAGGGLKFDGEKPRYDLLPWGAIDEVVKVLTVGASKYAPNNWQQVQGGRWRYFGAAARHLAAYARGERDDPETGLHHLAHAVCCCLFIVSLDRGVASSTLHDSGDA